MDELKAEIENLKINGDKIMGLLQDLRDQQKATERPSERIKRGSSAIDDDWIEDEIRTVVKKGLEPS